MRFSGRTLTGSVAALVASVAPVVAFACTNIPEIQAGVYNAPALSRTTVSLTGFADAPVQVHWNSVDGPVLATVAGPVAAFSVTLPDAAPNVYYLYAVQQSGDSTRKAVTTLEVTGPAGAVTGGQLRSRADTQAAGVGQTSDGLSAVGTGLLALSAGLLLMISGFGVAELRRRRVTAPVESGEQG